MYHTCCFWICLAVLSVKAAPCIRLGGVVRDYSSHQPLSAQLYLKTPTGRTRLNSSTDAGLFTIDVSCTSLALIIEKDGYRPQLLPLNTALLSAWKESIWVIIPLIAVDEQGSNRPYMQTQQTFFVQTNTNEKASSRPQHNVFTISDALIGKSLPAKICFVPTKTGPKKCLTADASGKVSIDFDKVDIIAFEVTSPGYQMYGGQLQIDQIEGQQLQHTIKLTRDLTGLSVRLSLGGSCELRPIGFPGKSIVPEPVPGAANVVATTDLLPQRYKLVIFDRNHVVREQRDITLRSGLNVADASITETPASVVAKPVVALAAPPKVTVDKPVAAAPVVSELIPAPLDRLDSLPMLYFVQSDHKLTPASEMTLLQVAAYLKQHSNVNIQLTGHTDKEGDERLNRTLAEQRAKVVSSFLFWHGVADNRMQIRGVGSKFPIAPSDTEENKAKNRRVAMKLITN